MRRRCYAFLFVILCLNVHTLSAQPELNGALGIPFGSTMEKAKKIMLGKPGVKLVKKHDASQNKKFSWPFYFFTGLTMDGYVIDTCCLGGSLTNQSNTVSKFKMARLTFKDPSADTYYAIVEILQQQYGNPDNSADDPIGGIVYLWHFRAEGSEVKNSIELEYFGPSYEHQSLTLTYRGNGTTNRKEEKH